MIAVAELIRGSAEPIAITFQEIQRRLGTRSRSATHRQIKVLGLKPYSRGHYRLRDVENAIARRTRT